VQQQLPPSLALPHKGGSSPGSLLRWFHLTGERALAIPSRAILTISNR